MKIIIKMNDSNNMSENKTETYLNLFAHEQWWISHIWYLNFLLAANLDQLYIV